MHTDISRVYGDHRHTGGRQGLTLMWRYSTGYIVTLILSVLVVPLVLEAQPRTQIPRVGFLRHLHQADEPQLGHLEEFRHGLRDLGYVEGQNLRLEVRWSEERLDHLAELAAELVRLPVDVLVVHGPPGVRAARDATSTIPIVMARMDDAVEHGFVASLAQPGGNITGISIQSGESSPKSLELLKDALPNLARVAVLWDATGTAHQRRTLEHAAPALGVHLQIVAVRSPAEFDSAFAAAHSAQAAGLMILGSPLMTYNIPRLAALAAQQRLPAIYTNRRFAEAGGLMTYGPKESDPSWNFRRAAVFVDKILKGAKPADLPVERPMKFELVINLKTAEALGLTIPPTILFQADEVIR
jgi:putative tryptophan/tyrosine transport system substrate-binding protein